MAKGNKEMLATVNFSMDVVKRIKAGDVFTKEEKQETLNGYIGLDDKNNSYWTVISPFFYFSNEPKKKPEYNHQVLKYINGFLGIEDDTEEHIQRFKFKGVVDQHWHLDEWDGLTNVNIYIDTVSKEYQKVKKPEETQWRDRTRKWYSGRFECDESLYNCTFGFSQYDNEPFGEAYVSYDFICSKSYRIKRLVEGLRDENNYLSNIK